MPSPAARPEARRSSGVVCHVRFSRFSTKNPELKVWISLSAAPHDCIGRYVTLAARFEVGTPVVEPVPWKYAVRVPQLVFTKKWSRSAIR